MPVEKENKKTLSKGNTKQKLIKAVQKILKRDGFKKIGVNNIAKTAGVDKVLIYRYFGGLDGLLLELINQRDFFSNLEHDPEILSQKDLIMFAKKLFQNQLKHIKNDPEMLELLRWELVENNALTEKWAKLREEKGDVLNRKISDSLPDINFNYMAISVILIGGIYYAALKSESNSTFGGIDLKTEKGWKEIQSAIDFIFDSVLYRLENSNLS